MNDIEQKIARCLDAHFSSVGFAESSVDALREAADVSLRTLYKYFPSREAMVVAALENRNIAYLEFLSGGPARGAEHVIYPIKRLGTWLSSVSCRGCLFLNALAAYPDSPIIKTTVEAHKEQVRKLFESRLANVAPNSNAHDLSKLMLSIHEGQTQLAMSQGPTTATQAALRLTSILLQQEKIT
ncbi:hypothetical protein BWR17_19590 (plasmid) [Phaeobacter inhibens]|uniref:TetR/AcrR family transcriptional regulator n=1 Tax=Phaeobacter inhibens TaxID=221822 RepID=UPI0009718439|nr:TetR/AcrR family transcriptional regulator [Phaeobacter inhibens]APX18087.1 hypothetical protein BWR17_19590 [Phaeobacter inhibens]